MNNKTWSCKSIQTWSPLHELSELRKTAINPRLLLIISVIEMKQVCI